MNELGADSIKIIFKDFIEDKEIQYAIMLNGKWGTGKTYFWKNTLSEIIKGNKKKPVYISLNGIKTVDELDLSLINQLIPFLKDVNSNSKYTIFKNSIISLIESKYKIKLTDITKGVFLNFFNLDDYVFCFDDFERCQIDILQLSGYLNNFIEHRNMKILIIGCKENISEKIKYDKTKEKFIGYELNYKVDISNIVEEFIRSYKLKFNDLYIFLENNKSLFKEIIEEYNVVNLRTIKFIFDIIRNCYIYFKEKEEIISEILFFIAIISIEYKNGMIGSNKSSDYLGLDRIKNEYYVLAAYKNGEKKPYKMVFYEKYLKNERFSYKFYPSIFEYILTGLLDKDKLSSETIIKKIQNNGPEHKVYSILISTDFRKLENDTFNDSLNKLISFVEDNKYSIYECYNIAALLLFLRNNEIISIEINCIKDKIKNSVNKIISSSVSPLFIDLFESEKDDINLKEIRQYIFDRIKDKETERLKHKYVSIMERIAKNDENSLVEAFDYCNHKEIFFSYFEISYIFKTFTYLSNNMIFKLHNLLQKRYELSNLYKYDLETICEFKKQMGDYLVNKDKLKQPRKFIFEGLLKTLDNIVSKLKTN